jgi:hypothetical protein
MKTVETEQSRSHSTHCEDGREGTERIIEHTLECVDDDHRTKWWWMLKKAKLEREISVLAR